MPSIRFNNCLSYMNVKIKKSLEQSCLHILIKVCLLIISVSYFSIGLHRLIMGAHELPQSIDNVLRFYAGGFIAIGLLAIWVIVANKTQDLIIFFFVFFVFMTGVGRLVSIINVGLPDHTYLFYLAIELLLPLLMLTARIKLNKELETN